MVARENVDFQRENVRANTAAFKGMRVEERAGQRATLDVLITQQNLIAAQLALLAAQHDQYVAEATLLRAIGRLEGPDLVPGLPQYDVAANLRGVEGRGAVPWMGLAGALDGLGPPGAGQKPISAPAALRGPAALAPPAATPPDDTLATRLPTTPIPGTVSPEPPPGPSP